MGDRAPLKGRILQAIVKLANVVLTLEKSHFKGCEMRKLFPVSYM